MSNVVDTVITVASLFTAISVIVGGFIAAYKWFLKQGKQDRDILRLKNENMLIVYALRACLDGLQQLGANHTVPQAKEELEKYINKQAHS